MDKQLLETTVSKVLNELRDRPIPLGVSNRHVHLSAEDYSRLFRDIRLVRKKDSCNRDSTRLSRPSR